MSLFHSDRSWRHGLRVVVGAIVLVAVAPALAQDLPGLPTPTETTQPQASPAIAARTEATADADIALRIRSIFTEITALRSVDVRASAGVVTLTGTVPAPGDVSRAEAIASRVAGVVTVQNDVTRDLKVDSNLSPILGKFTDDLRGLLRALPLIAVALGIALVIGYLGHLLASLGGVWRRISPNAFLAELLATLIRFAFIMLGIVAGLEVLGATALLGAVLGGAGVIGIAIGFAVRDTVDNYVSSLMLSLRQPFR
ncbi:MAG: BON domain-containing protein, partial [Sphingomonas sp.]